MIRLFTILIIILSLSLPANAEFFKDIVVTSKDGIWTDSRAFSTISDAITAIGALERDLYIAREETIVNLTIPSNIRLHFLKSGAIKNSGTLLLNTKTITGDHQIFTGSGAVNFTPGSEVKSSWFSSFETAIIQTANDVVILLINKADTLNNSAAVGNGVILKWDSLNLITVSITRTLSNIGTIQAPRIQLFNISGAVTFSANNNQEIYAEWFYNSLSDITITNAVTAIGALTRTLSVGPGTWLITNDLIIPTNINLAPEKGAVLTLSNTKALTINGPITCGLWQCFNDLNTDLDGVVFGTGTVEAVLPQWFYSGTGSWHIAIQSAVNAAPTTGHVFLPPMTYSCDAGIDIAVNKNLTITGIHNKSILQMSSSFVNTDILLDFQGSQAAHGTGNALNKVSGLYIIGQNDKDKDGTAIKINYGNNFRVSDVTIIGVRNQAINVANSWDSYFNNIFIYGCGWDSISAVKVHTPVIAPAMNNTNGAYFYGCQIERCFGTSLEFDTGSTGIISACKLHGRAVADTNIAYVGPLIKISNFLALTIVDSHIQQFRHQFVADGAVLTDILGAIHITNDSDVSISSCTFTKIGDETGAGYDTYGLFYDPSASGRLTFTNNICKEASGDPPRANTYYCYFGAAGAADSITIGRNRFTTFTTSYIPIEDMNCTTTILPINCHVVADPADSTTYYAGAGGSIQTITTSRQIKSPIAGIVKYVNLNFNCIVGTAENVAVYLHKSAATDYVIAADLQLDATDRTKRLAIPLDVGGVPCFVRSTDYFHIRLDTPAWVTNPTALTVTGYIAIQEP